MKEFILVRSLINANNEASFLDVEEIYMIMKESTPVSNLMNAKSVASVLEKQDI